MIYVFGISMRVRSTYIGFHQKEDFKYIHETMTSSGDSHQPLEVKIRDEHLEVVICLKLIVHFLRMVL
jgi:hypothetical protein